MRFANITIIEGNDASQYGIGMVCARIAEIIIRDEKMVIPIGTYHKEHGVTYSLPSIVGAQGVERVLMPNLSSEEADALQQCIQVLKEAN